MTPSQDKEQDQGPSALYRAISRARLVILWERAWPRIVLFLGVLAIVLGASWLGFWQSVPFYARFFGVMFVAAILVLSLLPVLTLRLPGDKAALHRLDAQSGQLHRPATTSLDELATTTDPFARALWAAHQKRMQEAAHQLKAGLPHPRMDQLDRYAIRILALLLIVPAFFLAGDERMSRLLTAFDWKAPPAPVTYRIDAWVNPPSYTARAPVILQTRKTGDDKQASLNEVVKVPAGSVLILRVTGNASVSAKPRGGLAEVPQEAAAEKSQSTETRYTIASDGTLTLDGLPDGTITWQFTAIADRAPTIALDGQPEIDRRNQLAVPYKVDDDYGVTAAEAKFALRDKPTGRNARPLVPPPDFSLTLPQMRMRTGSGVALKDFTTHPWAGAIVTMHLTATDDAGNEGRSESTSFVLPGRIFTKPIAKALIEERRNLAINLENRKAVAYALEAMMLAPETFSTDTATYLGLSTARLGVIRAQSEADLLAVVDFLWEMAVRLEDGDIAESERNLQQAAEALRQAIERGASEEEIRRLTERLREAMNRFMRELAERQMRNRAQNPQQQARRPDANTRMIRPQDLAEMLNRIENLARNGAKEQAERLMQELQQMLEGLQAGRQQDEQQAEGEGQDSLSQLGDMIRRQQELRDQTFRRNQQQRRERLGQRNQQDGENEREFGDIQKDQEKLRQLLDQLAEQLGEEGQDGEGQEGQQGQQGQQGPGQQGQQGQGQGQGMGQARRGLGQARRAMRDAEGALGRGEGQGAADAQARALRGLQQGAQGLAQQMQEGQGQGDGQGRGPGNPQGRGTFSSRQTDPLGRNGTDNGLNDGDTRLNNNNRALGAARRAQDVLEELRRRLGEPHRPAGEIDYIERLLRGQQMQ